MSRRMLALCYLCCLLCVSCATSPNASVQVTPDADQPGSNLPSPTAQSLPSLLQTEQLLLMTPQPARDLFSLAQRLKGYTQPAHATPSVPLNEQVGHEQDFWIENQDTSTYQSIRARLVALTTHASFYVEDGQPFNQTALQASADTFEQPIYPTDRAQFEAESVSARDSEMHITILNAVNLGHNSGGAFLTKDEYPSSVSPYSNQREMFYINLDSEIPGSAGYNATVANEFSRLLVWHQQASAPSWLNEGLAVLAQRLNTYSAGGVDIAFVHNPDTQLTHWSGQSNLNAAHAGASYLFMDYFAEHYGGYGLLKEVLHDPAPPPTNFDDVLAKHGYADHFIDVVGKWMVANALADPSIEGGIYGYPNIHLPAVTPQLITAYPSSESDQVQQYAAHYYELHFLNHASRTLTIHFSGSPTVRLVGNDPLGSNDEWWGNRGNNLDSTLTHPFDLSHVQGQPVTLQFAAWFDLEPAHDYAYVEVSSDGGAHWRTLPGNSTTTDNPSGLNLGNGYTGTSGGGLTPTWVQESVDLSQYAGKKILVRFEEVTDEAVHLQGFALDQIRIPALHFQDDLSTDNGWVSAGFVRSNNILPERYLIQAVIFTDSHLTVQALNVDLATAQGTLSIPHVGNQVTQVILIVAAYAPKTTLQAHYQLEMNT